MTTPACVCTAFLFPGFAIGPHQLYAQAVKPEPATDGSNPRPNSSFELDRDADGQPDEIQLAVPAHAHRVLEKTP